MSPRIDPLVSGLVFGVALWLGLLWTWTRFNLGRRGRWVNVSFGVAAMLLLFVPFGGRPLWNWAFSFCPNPSLPMLGLVSAALWQHLFGVTVFKPADWRAAWIFGAVAGSLLYLHPMALGGLDLYYWGWHGEVAIYGLAALTLGFLAWGNRLGVLFLAALVAHRLGALESRNCWDYVVDPFYWMASLAMGATHAVGWLMERRRPNGTEPQGEVGLELVRLAARKTAEDKQTVGDRQ